MVCLHILARSACLGGSCLHKLIRKTKFRRDVACLSIVKNKGGHRRIYHHTVYLVYRGWMRQFCLPHSRKKKVTLHVSLHFPQLLSRWPSPSVARVLRSASLVSGSGLKLSATALSIAIPTTIVYVKITRLGENRGTVSLGEQALQRRLEIEG